MNNNNQNNNTESNLQSNMYSDWINNQQTNFSNNDQQNNISNNNQQNNISNNNQQNTIYTNRNINSKQSFKAEEKPYLVISDEQLKDKRTKNKAITCLVYSFFFIIAGFVYYMYQMDRHEFYIVKNEVLLANKSKYQIELTPKNAEIFDYLNYKYEVEDKNIADVNAYGEIEAKQNGETNLKIKYKNSFTSKNVKIKVEDIDIEKIEVKDNSNGKLQKGESVEITSIVNGNEEIKKNVGCRSSDESVVIIDNDCKTVTPVNEGTASIIIDDPDGEEKEEVEYEVINSETDVEMIELAESNIVLRKGTRGKIDTKIVPSTASNKNLSYISDNDSVTVDENGNIYGNKVGVSVITIESENGVKAFCTVEVEEKSISVESVTIKEQTKELKTGESYQLGVEIEPGDATERELTWTTSDSEIVAVSDGKITGIKAGEAEVTASSSNGLNSTSKIKILPKEILISKIDVKEKNVVIEKGSKYIIGVVIEPGDATDKKLTYTSNNNKISVDSTGVVYAKEEGKSIVTITSSNGQKNTVEIEVVNKKIEPTKIVLNETAKEMKIGTSAELIATLEPKETTVRTITWDSTNKNVVSVVNGKIVAQNGGEATITATTANGLSAKCKVIVKVPVKNVTINGENQLKINTTYQLKANIEPSNASDKNIIWSSSDPSIATIDNQGVVTGKKVGKTIIKVKALNGVSSEKVINVIQNSIALKEIVINPDTVSVNENKTVTLSATFKPSNASDRSITWISSNPKIATVSATGVVKGIAKGETTITVKSSNGIQGTRKIKVTTPDIVVTKVNLNITSTTINNGETINLKATVEPSNATNNNITWTTSDKSIATVSNGKVVAGTKTGTVKITAQSSNGKIAICTIFVKSKVKEILPSEVSLNTTSSSIDIGKTLELKATIKPSNATSTIVTWTSSNNDIATVQDGKVTGRKAGQVTITAKTINGKAATCKVNVKEIVATKVTLNTTSKTMKIGESFVLNATIEPNNTNNKNISWISSNPVIASVENGKVVAKNSGETTITAKTANGKMATCKVTVIKNSSNNNQSTNILNPIVPSGKLKDKLESNTLKVYIKDEGSYYLSYIWANSPVNQLRKQYTTNGPQPAKSLLEETVKNNNLKDKIFIGFNNNYPANGLNQNKLSNCPNCKNKESLPLIISNGSIVDNHCESPIFDYRMAYIDGNNKFQVAAKLNDYSKEERKKICNNIINSGTKNTFLSMIFLIDNNKMLTSDNEDGKAARQAFCQINTNNFVLLSSKDNDSKLSRKKMRNILKNLGCVTAVQFDSGHSTNTFYKKAGTNKLTKLACADTSRKHTAVLYFTELN